jgi:hypothetical protein
MTSESMNAFSASPLDTGLSALLNRLTTCTLWVVLAPELAEIFDGPVCLPMAQQSATAYGPLAPVR